MNLLLMLQAMGHPFAPGSDASEFDFNGNGVIDMHDFLEYLSQQPPIYTGARKDTAPWK